MAERPGLWMAEGLTFPVDVLTETLLIIAKRGSGKTYSASVLVEEMVGAGLPVCVIDPLGVWWGLRSSADGEGPGLPVTIIGGEHADLPLPPDGGTSVADLVIEEHLPVVLDLSELSKTKQRAFMCAFLERLYHRNREPLHIVIDEADLFAPMRATGEIARLLGAYEDIVRRGRARGLGCTSITQRPAVLHTDIRSQAEVLIALRLIGTHDVAAIDEWVRLHATDEEAREVKASLPSLPVGTAWVWSPGWLELLVKVKIRARLTFDSSATPKVGQRAIVPRQFAAVDPAELERMAVRLKATAPPEPPAKLSHAADVSRLARRVKELEAALAEARQRPPEQVEVPAYSAADLEALSAVVAEMYRLADRLQDPADRLDMAVRRIPLPSPVPPLSAGPVQLGGALMGPPVGQLRPRPTAPVLPPAPVGEGTVSLKAGARTMLAVLARQHPVKVTRAQLATLAKLKVTGGTFGTYFSVLRRAGLITEDGGFVVLTEAGFAAAGATPATPITPDELRETWRGALKAGARNMLDVLLERWPDPVDRQALADAVGLEVTGGTFGTYLSTLRRNGLAVEDPPGAVHAADVFFLGASGD
jgi:Helicase HerA, central domain